MSSHNDKEIYALDFSRNGLFIASVGGDHTVRLWDTSTNQQVMVFTAGDGFTSIAISPDNRFVAAGSLDGSVYIWDTSNGRLLEHLKGEVGHKDCVYSVAFAPNGKDLISGSLDKTVKVWELSMPPENIPGTGSVAGKCTKTLEGHKVSEQILI